MENIELEKLNDKLEQMCLLYNIHLSLCDENKKSSIKRIISTLDKDSIRFLFGKTHEELKGLLSNYKIYEIPRK
jgi:hypothetical protein